MEEEIIRQLAADYNMPVEKVGEYYTAISGLPFIEDYGLDLVHDCLEKIVQDVETNEFKKQNPISTPGGYEVKKFEPKSMEYIISDALYTTYGDDAVPYLSEEYKEVNEKRYQF